MVIMFSGKIELYTKALKDTYNQTNSERDVLSLVVHYCQLGVPKAHRMALLIHWNEKMGLFCVTLSDTHPNAILAVQYV